MANQFRKQNIPALTENIGTTLSVVIESPTAYGVTTSQCEVIGDLRDELIVASETANLTNQAKLAAFEARNVKWEQLLDAIGDFTKRIYADPNVDDQMLKAAGLSERAVPAARPPQLPLELVATPNANGTVELKWKRNGNPPNAVFVVESRGATGGWSVVGNFTVTRVTVNNFAPGVERFFRVYATRNNQSSLKSNEAVIYPDGESFTLSEAA